MNRTPIRRSLMSMLLLTSCALLLVSTAASFAYEFLTYRHSAVQNIATLGQIIANNSTAALAFDNPEDARNILSALKAEPHIVVGALYDRRGALFASYAKVGSSPASAP